MRTDVSKRTKEDIMRLLSEEEDIVRRANKRKLVKSVYKGVNTSFTVRRFVMGFRRRLKERNEMKARKKIEDQKDAILRTNEIDQLVSSDIDPFLGNRGGYDRFAGYVRVHYRPGQERLPYQEG